MPIPIFVFLVNTLLISESSILKYKPIQFAIQTARNKTMEMRYDTFSENTYEYISEHKSLLVSAS